MKILIIIIICKLMCVILMCNINNINIINNNM